MAEPVYWTGYLKLSLVTCAVRLVAAVTEAERVRFNLLNRKTGNRLRRQMVDAETGDEVDDDAIVRGYEYAKDRYVMLTPDELGKVALASTRTLEIDTFCQRDAIDSRYLERPYYLVPDDEVSAEPFAVIRAAMEATGRVGVGRVVVSRRERIMMLEPRGRGLVAWALHYTSEIRDAHAVYDRIDPVDVDKGLVGEAERLIDRHAGTFDPRQFDDRQQAKLRALIEAKAHGEKARRARRKPSAKGTAAVSLVDQLKRSLTAGDSAAERESGPAKRASTKGASTKGASTKRTPTNRASAKRASPKRASAKKAARGSARMAAAGRARKAG